MKHPQFTYLFFALITLFGWCTPHLAAQTLTRPAEDSECDSYIQAKKQKVSAREINAGQIKFYGFVRSNLICDSRASQTALGGTFYNMPLDRELNEYGDDLNRQWHLSLLSLTSRIGMNWIGYQFGNTHISTRLEADFGLGVTNGSGTAQMRLRHAHIRFDWKDLPMSKNDTAPRANISLLVGQAFHPMNIGTPSVIATEPGTPFHVNNRSPQIRMDAQLGNFFTLTAATIWQMQYTNTGPEGKSAKYQLQGCVPECFLAMNAQAHGFTINVGANLLSIKPRITNLDAQGVKVKVRDRLTTITPYIYLKYQHQTLLLQAMSYYGNATEQTSILSGYIQTTCHPDGSSDYVPIRTSTSWLSLQAGKKLQGMLFLGYSQNLGTRDQVEPTSIFYALDVPHLRRLGRLEPAIVYNWGKLQLGIEYSLTAAQYGNKLELDNHLLANTDLHWIINHRMQAILKFTF